MSLSVTISAPTEMSRYNYTRRPASEVRVGNITIGGSAPIRLQSMTNTSTLDTESSARQAVSIAAAGGELVRLTTQGPVEAANMEAIKARVRELGSDVPLVADIHFNTKAAYTAAPLCEKVRINPGNFADPARTFEVLRLTDEEYAAELERIRTQLLPFIELCKKHHTAVRLGVNHGSLSDRIMSRYGDTPAGMVESVMEYLRIFAAENFHDIVISIKASNTRVMIDTVRLLVSEMDKADMHYPLHLGVTEAGDADDGRIKSAVGIGTLLAEGLGDTIRVSLSEDPVNEIPVARMLRDYIAAREGHEPIEEPSLPAPYPAREAMDGLPGMNGIVAVIGLDINEIPSDWQEIDTLYPLSDIHTDKPVLLTSHHANPVGDIEAYIDRMYEAGLRNPVAVTLDYSGLSDEEIKVRAAADFGTILVNGYAAAIQITADGKDDKMLNETVLSILQAARLRFTKTEYIACPGCGRTLFDLQQTLHDVKAATSHLSHLKIGVMGCIVNGPGEMADADFGYVGSGRGRINLFRGKECVEKNIPQSEAIPRLIALIKANGQWREPND